MDTQNNPTGKKSRRKSSTKAGKESRDAATQSQAQPPEPAQSPEAPVAEESAGGAASGSAQAPGDGQDFLVVGIGASAGGVSALEQFFEGLPDERTGMAFVVVTHLSPDHESDLAAIIGNHTGMPVAQVNEQVRVQPDSVYVIPPGKNLSITDGMIDLSALDQVRGQRAPIDLFFRTLADSRGEASAAVVLSGTGSDGAIGLPRVKEMGGVTLVQDPDEAEHSAMPRNAIATGFADYVLPARGMGERLLAYDRNRHAIGLHVNADALADGGDGRDPDTESTEDPQSSVERKAAAEPLYEIIALLHARTSHNFAAYKRSTLARRVERRLQVNDLPDLPSYLAYLRAHPSEVQYLLRDLLISVTNFFRDEEAWNSLATKVLPILFKDKDQPDSVVRAWVAGCATGEEAYTVAMLLHDFASRQPRPPKIQVFATDLDDNAISIARAASYPETIAADVPPELLRRYFIHQGRRYRLVKEVRESVLFAVHDLLKDPPFSKLDLITCRNLLIYLNRDAQEQVLTLFHFALQPEGYLLLGTSESVDGVSQLFTAADKKHRIFKRRAIPHFVQAAAPVQLAPGPVTGARGAQLSRPPYSPTPGPQERPPSPLDVHRISLERYAPPSVLVDENYGIVHMSNNVVRYLQLRGGEPTHDLMRLVHPDLRLDLRNALYNAAQRRKVTQTRRIQLRLDGADRPATFVRALVRPVDEPGGYILVLFDELGEFIDGDRVSTGAADDGTDKPARDLVAGQLEEEVQDLRAQLRTIIEQYETSVEELKASNEELQAINEELRSATEELETSKEEIQATNEELLTVNQELKVKVEEVSRSHADLQNFMVSSEIATIFLSRGMQVKRYTPSVERIFNIIPTDIDRPIIHVTHRLRYGTLVEDAQAVLGDLVPVEREVQTTDDDWYIVRLLPYRTLEDRIDGVVITFTDITERKRTEEAAARAERSAEGLLERMSDAYCVLDREFYIRSVNAAAERLLSRPRAELLGRSHWEAFPASVDAPVGQAFRRVVEEGTEQHFTHHYTGEGYDLYLEVDAYPTDEGGVAMFWRDVSERVRAEAAVRASEEKYRMLFSEMDEAYAVVEAMTDAEGRWSDFRFLEVNPAFMRHTGMPYPVGQTATQLLGSPNPRWAELYGHAAETGESIRVEEPEPILGRMFDLNIFRLGQEGSRRVAVLFTDITGRKRTEEGLILSHQDLEERVNERTADLARANETLKRLSARLLQVQEEERRRIARELHDEIGQYLTGLRFMLEKPRGNQAGDTGATDNRLGEVLGVMNDITQKVRDLALDLRPAMLDDIGLLPALLWYTERFTFQTGIRVDFQHSGLKERLPSDIETAVYRVVQEALTNVARHSEAEQVTLQVFSDGHLIAIIEDRGRGFPVEEVRSQHISTGISAMRERVELVGGEFTVDSAPGRGTTIIADIPVHDPDAPEAAKVSEAPEMQ